MNPYIEIKADKTCNRCKIPKPLKDFHKHRRSKDGRETICAACTKERIMRLQIIKNEHLRLQQLSSQDVVMSEAYMDDRIYFIFRSVHDQIKIELSSNNYVRPSKPLFEYEKIYIKINYPDFKFYEN